MTAQKIALVGAGYWGPKLLRNLVGLVGGERVVVVDRSLPRIEAMAIEYPTIGAHLTLEAALENEPVEAVIVATPVGTHADLARQALAAGCHVLVEKPLTDSTASAAELVALSAEARRALMVGHTFLFSPRVRHIADHLATGDVGSLHYATSSRLNLGLHRYDANVIWDLAAHDFSILCYLLGEFPTAVQTAARSVRRADLPEVAFISMQFPSGVIAAVDVSWLAPRKVRNTVLVGDHQMVVYDDTNSDEPIKIYDKGVAVPDSSDFGEHQLTYRYGDTVAPHVVATEPLTLQLAEFLEAVNGAASPRSDGEFGLHVVEALEAADQSWRRGGVPVEVGSTVRISDGVGA